jgi:FolB domain-containing protein
MVGDRMDKIIIRDLSVNCIIGTNPDERVNKQEIILNLIINTDLSTAGVSDKLDDALDYFVLTDKIVTHLEQSEYFLLEKMAEKIASICLAEALVVSVEVTVDKPEALDNTRSVAVQLYRKQEAFLKDV